MNNCVKVNSFVKRQIEDSGKTYSTLSFEEIALYAQEQVVKGNYQSGYRDGVIIISVEEKLVNHFTCPFTLLSDDSKLVARMTRRRPDEEPYIQIRSLNGNPLETGSALHALASSDGYQASVYKLQIYFLDVPCFECRRRRAI